MWLNNMSPSALLARPLVSVDGGSGDREDESGGVRELRVGEWVSNKWGSGG